MAIVENLMGGCGVANDTAKVTMELFGQYGQESDTLRALYDFCLEHPNDLVWYTHSKGAYHSFGSHNMKHRVGQDRFVIGKDFHACHQLMLQGATVCGPRFSTTPHPHYSGNAWWANCSYVASLGPPVEVFNHVPCPSDSSSSGGHPRVAIDFRPVGIAELTRGFCTLDYAMAVSRYSSEHWIASSPGGIFASAARWVKTPEKNLVEDLIAVPVDPSPRPDLTFFGIWPKSGPWNYWLRLTSDWILQLQRNPTLKSEPRTFGSVLGFLAVHAEDSDAISKLDQQLARFDSEVMKRTRKLTISVDGKMQAEARTKLEALLHPHSSMLDFQIVTDGATSLELLHGACISNPDAAVYHFVADTEARPSQDELVIGKGFHRCLAMLERNGSTVCGEHVAIHPHVHLPGSYFVASCAHLCEFIPPAKARAKFEKCTAGKDEYRLLFEAHDAQYEKLCAPDWCLGVGEFEEDHWIGTNPSTRFAVCPAAAEDCRHFSFSDVSWTMNQKLERPVTIQLEFCGVYRGAYDWERWILRDS